MNDEEKVPPGADPEKNKPPTVRGLGAADLLDLVEVPADDEALWTPLPPEDLQEVLRGYEVIRIIGTGGMGAVYEVRQPNLDRRVALKLLPVEVVGADPAFSERFRREAKIMSRLQHPGIVSVYEFGSTDGGDLYFTMELVDGETLTERQASGNPGQGEAIALLRQVCDAVAHAHGEGIIHRDLKPANILIAHDGQVKVVDFGLAIPASRTHSEKLTRRGVIVGTLDYLAPEQWRAEPVDERSDIYSLGVIGYELLTGEVPRGAFEPPSLRRKSVDAGFDEVILRALQMDRESRYASVAEFRDDLVDAYEKSLLGPETEPEGEVSARVLTDFYEKAVAGLPGSIRRFIEDKLITPSGYRDSRALDEVISLPDFSRQWLERLVENRLLRIERRGGVQRVEIRHDRVTGAIQASRDARRVDEERAQAVQREKRLKRRFRLRMGLVLGAVALGILVVWLVWQQRVSEFRARHEAEMRRESVRVLMDMATGKMLDDLEGLGKISLLEEMHHTIETTLNSYPASFEDAEFNILRARLLKNQGYVRLVRGLRGPAEEKLERAFALFRGHNVPREAVECALMRAENLLEQGLPEKAQSTLAGVAPLLPAAAAVQSHYHRVLSRVHRGLRQWPTAVAQARQALDLLNGAGQPPAPAGPGMLERELALAESELAQALDASGETTQGLEHHGQAARLSMQAAGSTNSNFRWKVEAAEKAGTLGAALIELGRKEEGRGALTGTLAFTSALLVRDPNNVPWRSIDAAANGWMAKALIEDERFNEAGPYIQKAVEQARSAANEDSGSDENQWLLAADLLQLAYWWSDQKRDDQAEPFYREAVGIMEKLVVSVDSFSPGTVFGLNQAMLNLGKCLKDQNKNAEALAHYQEWETRAMARASSRPSWWYLSAAAARRVAEMQRAEGDPGQSLNSFRRSLTHLVRLSEEGTPRDAPSRGGPWRRNAAEQIQTVIDAALTSPAPQPAEARALAAEAARVLFEVWKAEVEAPEDTAAKAALLKAAAAP